MVIVPCGGCDGPTSVVGLAEVIVNDVYDDGSPRSWYLDITAECSKCGNGVCEDDDDNCLIDCGGRPQVCI